MRLCCVVVGIVKIGTIKGVLTFIDYFVKNYFCIRLENFEKLGQNRDNLGQNMERWDSIVINRDKIGTF